jgi:hypothetical protein
MTKINAPEMKTTNGKATTADQKAIVAAANAVINPEVKAEEKPLLPAPAPEPIKEMTLIEKILKVENLSLLIEKRAKLVQTRSELERFQTASNDFNCNMRLNDSDGNVFTTSFTPGIKKVIDFLKTQFDASITDVEQKIKF